MKAHVSHPDHTPVAEYRELVHRQLQRWDAYGARREGLADYDRWRAMPVPSAVDALYAEFLQGRSVLEIGCGAGHLLQRLTSGGVERQYTGIDLSQSMLCGARDRGFSRIACADGNRLPFADGSFDAVVAGHWVFRYLDPGDVLREVRRVLRPAGQLLFDVPLLFRHAVALAGDLARTPPRRWGHRVRDARLHLNPATGHYWKRRLERGGFRVQRQVGVLQVPGVSSRMNGPVLTEGWARNLADSVFVVARKA